MSDKMKDLPPLPGAHYGPTIEEKPDYTEDDNSPLPEIDDYPDDDQQHGDVDPHLVEMLGFNPRDLPDEDEDEEETETVTNKDGSISKRKR